MAGFRSRFLVFGHIHFALGRSYYWFSDVGACEEPMFSVLSPEFSWFLWQHVKSHETASASLCWSLSSGGRFLTVATRVSLAFGPLASLKVVFSGGGSNLHFTIPNDGTAGLWTPPRAAGLCPVLQGLGVPFSPGARGNRELSPFIPLLWTIDATLLPLSLEKVVR
ncbi:hypothetical protein IGI04_009715 [Brassica rapa subsp. trilocularis]|uniref:Secreted protein n=1 Tax=Brassica rapa subsp. trilocularis TaxID=1813537 RepID=A0ABQ7N0F4_BRACM|nr:hypothetical protein IGI04_009715 [Brassica rapa subsp. trilocularis]